MSVFPSLAAALALVAIGVAGCGASAQTTARPITVETRPVSLNAEHPDMRRVGALTYAGGLVLTAPGVAGFGGLSGLDVRPDGRFLAPSDGGELLAGRIVLGADGQLAGLAETSLARLTDEAGDTYPTKNAADAEDITFLPGGGYAVSFEQNHRVQAYRGEGPAVRLGIPAEAAEFDGNAGLEALTAWIDASGRPGLLEGAEDGRIWSCDEAGLGCRLVLGSNDGPSRAYKLTGLDALPDGRGVIAVYRSFDLIRGLRTLVAWIRPDRTRKLVVLARLAPPFTVDNMEGVAVLPNPDGSIRIYLISDDNMSKLQRTLLMAFDWRGPRR